MGGTGQDGAGPSCPTACPTNGATHITARAARLALESPVTLLTLLALGDRRVSLVPPPKPPSPSKALGDPAGLRGSPNPDGEDPACAQTSPAPFSPSPRRHPPPPAAPAWWDREGAASEGPRGPPALHRMRAQSQFGSPSITHRLSALPLLALRPLSALRREGEGGEGVLEFVGGCWDPGEGAEGGLRVGVSPARGHRGLCARSQRPAGGEEVAQGGDVAHLCGAGGSPWARAPLGGVGGAAGGTHTLAFLPFGAVGAGQAALTLPSLQEEEGGEV